MAKGDAATQNNASAMQMDHAPLNAALGAKMNDGNAIARPNIAPSPNVMSGLINSGAQLGTMPMPRSIAPSYDPSVMSGVGSVSRMTGGNPSMANLVGSNVNSPIAPTNQNELIRRIMMMSQF